VFNDTVIEMALHGGGTTIESRAVVNEDLVEEKN
jgi:hypothetical protein